VDDAPARPPARRLRIAVLSGVLTTALVAAHVAVGRLTAGDSEQVLLHLLLSGTAGAVAAAFAARRVRRTEADLARLAFSDVPHRAGQPGAVHRPARNRPVGVRPVIMGLLSPRAACLPVSPATTP
jgi:hypothetical protein